MTTAERLPARSAAAGVGPLLARPGGLSHLEIPAIDARRSAEFYASILGWNVDQRGTDDYRFRDITGHMIDRWVADRPTSVDPGLLLYFYVASIDEAVARVPLCGGKVVRAKYAEGNLWVATVRDPAGKIIALWQDPAH